MLSASNWKLLPSETASNSNVSGHRPRLTFWSRRDLYAPSTKGAKECAATRLCSYVTESEHSKWRHVAIRISSTISSLITVFLAPKRLKLRGAFLSTMIQWASKKR